MRGRARRFVARAIAAALMGLASSGPATAASFADLLKVKTPNMRWDQLRIHPRLRLSESYDSNIYLVAPGQGGAGDGVRGSWITMSSLGVGLDLPIHKVHEFEARYDLQALLYSTQPSLNDAINHEAGLRYGYRGAYGVSAEAREDYVNTTVPATTELTRRDRRWGNELTGSLSYAPDKNRFTASVDLLDSVQKYSSTSLAALLDRDELAAGLKLGCRLQPKTTVFVSYHRGIVHFPVGRLPGQIDRDSKYHHAQLGAEGDLLSQLTGLVEGGLKYRQFDEADPSGATRTRDWTVGTKVLWQPRQRTTLELSLYRFPQASVESVNRDYVANDAQLTVRHKLPRQFMVTAELGLSINRYREAETTGGLTAVRRDDVYRQALTLEYDIREWLTAGLNYLHRERNSVFTEQYNYRDHVTGATVALMF